MNKTIKKIGLSAGIAFAFFINVHASNVQSLNPTDQAGVNADTENEKEVVKAKAEKDKIQPTIYVFNGETLEEATNPDNWSAEEEHPASCSGNQMPCYVETTQSIEAWIGTKTPSQVKDQAELDGELRN